MSVPAFENERLTPNRIPAARYRSVEWRKLESERLWPAAWQFACTVDCIPESGDWFEYKVDDLSAILVRGEDGVVRGFQNACRHRGNILLTGSGRGLAGIRCDYHHWCYDLQGRRGTSPGRLDLLPVRAGTWAGLIYVNWDPLAPSLEDCLGVLPQELSWVGMERYTCQYAITVAVECNWKLIMDAFNEAYHIHAVHPQLLPLADDVNLPIRLLGEHSTFEQTFAVPSPRLEHDDAAMWRAFQQNVNHRLGVAYASPASAETVPPIPDGQTLKDVLLKMLRTHLQEIGDPYPNLDDRRLMNDFHYYVFPNMIVNVFAGWFGIVRARPGPSPDTAFLDMWNFDVLGADHPKAHCRPEMVNLSPDNTQSLGLVVNQDLKLLPRIQKGLVQPGVKELTLVAAEARIGHMHSVLDRYLGTSVAAELGS
jgi:choline monooxygenase